MSFRGASWLARREFFLLKVHGEVDIGFALQRDVGINRFFLFDNLGLDLFFRKYLFLQ